MRDVRVVGLSPGLPERGEQKGYRPALLDSGKAWERSTSLPVDLRDVFFRKVASLGIEAGSRREENSTSLGRDFASVGNGKCQYCVT